VTKKKRFVKTSFKKLLDNTLIKSNYATFTIFA